MGLVTEPPRLPAGLLARNSVLNLVGQVLPLLLALVCIPIILHGLGAQRFGVLALSWIVVGYFGVFDLGMGRAATKFISEALGRGDRAAVPELVHTAVLAQLGLGVLGGLVLAVVAPLLVEHVLSIPAALADEARAIFYLLAGGVPVVLISGSLRGTLEAAQRFGWVNAVNVSAASSNLLLPVVGVLAGWSLPVIVAALLVPRFASAAAFAWLCARLFPGVRGRIRASREGLRAMLGFGGWVMMSNVTIPVLTHLDRLLIASFLPVAALTFYTVPYEITARASVLPAAMAMALFPAFSYYQGSGAAGVRELLARPLRYLLFGMTPVLAFFVAFAPDLLALWVGPEFAQRSALPLRILALGFFLNGFAYVPFAAVQGLGRPDLKAKLDLGEVPLFGLLCLLLIPGWGIVGAAIAKLAISLVDLAGLVWLVRRFVAPAAVRLEAALVRAAGLAVGYLACVLAVTALVDGLAVSVAGFAACTLAYIAVCWKFATDAKDRSILLGLKAGLSARSASRAAA